MNEFEKFLHDPAFGAAVDRAVDARLRDHGLIALHEPETMLLSLDTAQRAGVGRITPHDWDVNMYHEYLLPLGTVSSMGDPRMETVQPWDVNPGETWAIGIDYRISEGYTLGVVRDPGATERVIFRINDGIARRQWALVLDDFGRVHWRHTDPSGWQDDMPVPLTLGRWERFTVGVLWSTDPGQAFVLPRLGLHDLAGAWKRPTLAEHGYAILAAWGIHGVPGVVDIRDVRLARGPAALSLVS